ncbi:hypothetical protein [Deminuibacter soli]|uniref:DUF3606 domain-containing protein n=1 Tax=Deminuibacter soli TaxID=2291815 RepID=A0A3E1NCU0_9BACT|nr:hypothetical protein [Deminuibacter soli]RFM25806.1 hypothetical protein DXN05_22865 [Deminuibacter soli]
MSKAVFKENPGANNVQFNFSKSPEIAYWARKYNISPEVLQQTFRENGYSIAQTIAAMQKMGNTAV